MIRLRSPSFLQLAESLSHSKVALHMMDAKQIKINWLRLQTTYSTHISDSFTVEQMRDDILINFRNQPTNQCQTES